MIEHIQYKINEFLFFHERIVFSCIGTIIASSIIMIGIVIIYIPS